MTQIANELMQLATSMLKKEEIFSKIPVCLQYMAYNYKIYLDSYEKLDSIKKVEILDAIISRAHYYIKSSLKVSRQTLPEMFPEQYKTIKEFQTWINENSLFFSNPIVEKKEKIPVNKLIKEIIKKRLPEFEKSKKLIGPHELSFAKSISDNNKVFVLFDKGTYRDFISIYFGVENPEFTLDIATFYSQPQSHFYCRNEDECIKELNVAIDYIQLIIPHFIKAIKNVERS